MSEVWDLRSLLSACAHLARRAGQVIREEHARGQLGAHNKKDSSDTREIEQMAGSEVLTIADTRAQDVIVSSLRGMFPGLRIVGEEGEVPQSAALTPFADVQLLPEPFNVPPALRESLTLADTCLWVDPLDGTKEFVMGNLENVSTLIGIAVRDRPVAGIICKPFVGDGDGRLVYGALGLGIFGDAVEPPREPGCTGTRAGGEEPLIVMSAGNMKNARVVRALERLTASGCPHQVVLSGACGQKLLKLALSEADAFVMSKGASRWDSCAGEAMVAALGGLLTDLDGQFYTYVENASYGNDAGMLAARDPALHRLLVQAFAEEDVKAM